MSWICNICETHNEGAENTCEVCGCAKPAKRPVVARKTSARVLPEVRTTTRASSSTTKRYASPSISVEPPQTSFLHLRIIGLFIAILVVFVAYFYYHHGTQAEKIPVSKGQLSSQSGYLQGTSGKSVATLYYKSATISGTADCSPSSKTLSLPPGHYRVRIEGVRHSIVASERETTIQSGRLTSIGPDN